MDRKPKVVSGTSWILDGIVFVFDPILGLMFFLFDLFESERPKRLVEEETKSCRSVV